MITASALRRDCGHPRALSKLEPTTAKDRDARARRDAAADKGTLFHAAIVAWKEQFSLHDILAAMPDDEVRGWLEMLAMSWSPRPGMLFEFAVGLTTNGMGVECDEPEPHVYVAKDGSPLLTAGRADVVWSSIVGTKHIVTVRDWKTGKWPVDPPARNLQLTALAMATLLMAGADGYRREIYYVRDGFTEADETPVMVGTDAWARADHEVYEAAQLDDAPRPGPHCEGCWEKRSRRCSHAA